MNNFILFLHGSYKTSELGFYKRLCRSKIKIAVNGGYSFFKKAQILPDLIIGDMDSIKITKSVLSKIKSITYPADKNKTDSQLAVEYCLRNKAKTIDIVMPSIDEADHFIGNIMFLVEDKVLRWLDRGNRIRIINSECELFFVRNNKTVFNRCVHDTVSVIPFSKSVVLSCNGTEYNVRDLRTNRGNSRSLRNKITTRRAVFSVKGEALIIHQFKKT